MRVSFTSCVCFFAPWHSLAARCKNTATDVYMNLRQEVLFTVQSRGGNPTAAESAPSVNILHVHNRMAPRQANDVDKELMQCGTHAWLHDSKLNKRGQNNFKNLNTVNNTFRLQSTSKQTQSSQNYRSIGVVFRKHCISTTQFEFESGDRVDFHARTAHRVTSRRCLTASLPRCCCCSMSCLLAYFLGAFLARRAMSPSKSGWAARRARGNETITQVTLIPIQ